MDLSLRTRVIIELIINSAKNYCLDALNYHIVFPRTVSVSLVAIQHILQTADEA